MTASGFVAPLGILGIQFVGTVALSFFIPLGFVFKNHFFWKIDTTAERRSRKISTTLKEVHSKNLDHGGGSDPPFAPLDTTELHFLLIAA